MSEGFEKKVGKVDESLEMSELMNKIKRNSQKHQLKKNKQNNASQGRKAKWRWYFRLTNLKTRMSMTKSSKNPEFYSRNAAMKPQNQEKRRSWNKLYNNSQHYPKDEQEMSI